VVRAAYRRMARNRDSLRLPRLVLRADGHPSGSGQGRAHLYDSAIFGAGSESGAIALWSLSVPAS
jgi:hypothetical protein